MGHLNFLSSVISGLGIVTRGAVLFRSDSYFFLGKYFTSDLKSAKFKTSILAIGYLLKICDCIHPTTNQFISQFFSKTEKEEKLKLCLSCVKLFCGKRKLQLHHRRQLPKLLRLLQSVKCCQVCLFLLL